MIRFKIKKSETLTVYTHIYDDHFSIVDRRSGVNYDACLPQHRSKEYLDKMVADYRRNPAFTECY